MLSAPSLQVRHREPGREGRGQGGHGGGGLGRRLPAQVLSSAGLPAVQC